MTIKKSIILLSLIILCSSAVIANAQDYSTEGNFKRIEQVSEWIVRQGIKEYYAHKDDEKWLSNETIYNRFVRMNYAPQIDESGEPFYARITLSTPGNYYRIVSLHRMEQSGSLFEFWTIKKHFDEDAINLAESHCQFFITKSENFVSERNILKSDTYFFDTFPVDLQIEFVVPLDNLELLYRLEAWDHSDCYAAEYSELTDYVVFAEGGGEYIRKKMTPFLRFQLFIEELRINLW